MNKPNRRLLSLALGFLCRFALLFGFLIVPWPGWNQVYGQYFRTLGDMAFANKTGNRLVVFEPHQLDHGFSSLGTRMTLGNRDLVNESGIAPVKRVELDTRSIGWVPTALTIALILATPIPWRRRAWAALGGTILIQLFILFFLQTCIWQQSPSLSLLTLSPLSERIVDELQYALITQLGASFSVPLVIWIVVTFRRQDVPEFLAQGLNRA